MSYNPDIHKRHSIRLKEYNYTEEGMYFITICIKNRENLLGEIVEDKMQLNRIGKIIEKELLNMQIKFQQANVNIYQIMPNHIHFILEIKRKDKIIIGNMIRYFKGRSSSKTKIYWQRNYYEHIIRNENEYYTICEYITNNPFNWNKDSNHM